MTRSSLTNQRAGIRTTSSWKVPYLVSPVHGVRNDSRSILEQREESVRLHPRLDEQALLGGQAGAQTCLGSPSFRQTLSRSTFLRDDMTADERKGMRFPFSIRRRLLLQQTRSSVSSVLRPEKTIFTGTLAYSGLPSEASRLAWFDRAGSPLGTVGAPAAERRPIVPDHGRLQRNKGVQAVVGPRAAGRV